MEIARLTLRTERGEDNEMMDQAATSNADSVEIEEIANSMAKDICINVQLTDETIHENRNSFQIEKIHQLVRQIDKFAYEPFVVSIGPIHHNNVRLQFMERMKWWCLDYILTLNCNKSLGDYLLAIGDIEKHARACYSYEINLDSKTFQRMLLLDGCFILVYLNGINGVPRITKSAPESIFIPDANIPGTGYATDGVNSKSSLADNAEKKHDTVIEIEQEMAKIDQRSAGYEESTSCHENPVVQWYDAFALFDLFLLENQIPFLVVRKICEVLAGSDIGNILAEKVANYVEENLQYMTKAFGKYDRPKEFFHLLHLCHMQFRPRASLEETNLMKPQFSEKFFKLFNIRYATERDEQNSLNDLQFNSIQGRQVTRWHRATQYHEAGVLFKRKEFIRHTYSMLDVSFHSGVLEIPLLTVDDRTGCLLRNMIAFEQTCPQFGNFVTAYVMFMSQLISRPDDVTLLSQRGIIVHLLHSDKVVSTLFTQLIKGVVFDFTGNFYLRSICWKMEMYYQSRLNRWIAWLRHNHLRNPWLGLALLAGLLVLFSTIAQTALTVLAYVGPP